MLLKRKGKISFKSSASTIIRKDIILLYVLQKKSKKQVLVLTISILVTVAKKKTPKDTKIGETSENGKNNKNGNEDTIYLKNQIFSG